MPKHSYTPSYIPSAETLRVAEKRRKHMSFYVPPSDPLAIIRSRSALLRSRSALVTNAAERAKQEAMKEKLRLRKLARAKQAVEKAKRDALKAKADKHKQEYERRAIPLREKIELIITRLSSATLRLYKLPVTSPEYESLHRRCRDLEHELDETRAALLRLRIKPPASLSPHQELQRRRIRRSAIRAAIERGEKV